MNIIKHAFYAIMILIVILSVNFLFPQKSFALVPFGAPILFTTVCTNGLMITIGPFPSAGNYLVSTTPPSKIFAFYSLKPGSWVLGGYVPGGVCVAPPGAPIPVLGTILLVGTSK